MNKHGTFIKAGKSCRRDGQIEWQKHRSDWWRSTDDKRCRCVTLVAPAKLRAENTYLRTHLCAGQNSTKNSALARALSTATQCKLRLGIPQNPVQQECCGNGCSPILLEPGGKMNCFADGPDIISRFLRENAWVSGCSTSDSPFQHNACEIWLKQMHVASRWYLGTCNAHILLLLSYIPVRLILAPRE